MCSSIFQGILSISQTLSWASSNAVIENAFFWLQVTAWSLFYPSWNETFLNKWTDTIASCFQIYHWKSFGQLSKGSVIFFLGLLSTNAQQVIHYFYISFYFMDNISLKLFTLTSKRKHFCCSGITGIVYSSKYSGRKLLPPTDTEN